MHLTVGPASSEVSMVIIANTEPIPAVAFIALAY